ncbi:uncharacterized protein LOC125084417 [Lutra lutra]|uniref:uncharacterized protein LOC125084417 n=1 Tax=Lutra lutra TaxID=9657 RepID=UPI001FCFA0CD|nr:uncharacterized protein LOC125084417 [Lutra lutra]
MGARPRPTRPPRLALPPLARDAAPGGAGGRPRRAGGLGAARKRGAEQAVEGAARACSGAPYWGPVTWRRRLLQLLLLLPVRCSAPGGGGGGGGDSPCSPRRRAEPGPSPPPSVPPPVPLLPPPPSPLRGGLRSGDVMQAPGPDCEAAAGGLRALGPVLGNLRGEGAARRARSRRTPAARPGRQLGSPAPIALSVPADSPDFQPTLGLRSTGLLSDRFSL